MSKPFENYQNCASGVSCEIMSGVSALHMNPKPIENPHGDYLSDTDHWVAHSIEHFHKATELANDVAVSFRNLVAVAELLIIRRQPDLHKQEWDKMTDIDKANSISQTLMKMMK